MAKIKITLTPDKGPQKIFDAGELAEALAGKKCLLGWNDKYEAGDAEYLRDRILDDLEARMKDKSGTTANMKKRLSLAKKTKVTVGGPIVGGKHILELKIAGVDGREEGTFPVPVEIDDPPDQPEAVTFEGLVESGGITFGSGKVQRMISADKNNKDKAASIYERGKSYKGHGPTADLGGALHAHVTNKTALGFRWSGDALEIVGFGVKSDSAGTGTSGYTWHQ